jgi:hypothetical protein
LELVQASTTATAHSHDIFWWRVYLHPRQRYATGL